MEQVWYFKEYHTVTPPPPCFTVNVKIKCMSCCKLMLVKGLPLLYSGKCRNCISAELFALNCILFLKARVFEVLYTFTNGYFPKETSKGNH